MRGQLSQRKMADALAELLNPADDRMLSFLRKRAIEAAGNYSVVDKPEYCPECRVPGSKPLRDDGIYMVVLVDSEPIAFYHHGCLRKHSGHELEMMEENGYRFLPWLIKYEG